MNYDVKVVERPAARFAGISERVSMSDSGVKCPALWMKFGPMMGALAPFTDEGSFGVCVMMDEHSFDYWAAVAVPSGAKVPAGMESIEIEAGKYAECVIKNLAELGQAYEYLYGEWEKTQKDYKVDFTGACFEFYNKNWNDGDPLTLFVPVQPA